MAKLGDFDLTEAEEKLCAALQEGKGLILGDDVEDRPGPDAGEDRQISADFLRYVLEGGCDALWGARDGLAAKGLRICGARITGRLDLEGMKLDHDLVLAYCHFDAAPLLRAMRLDSLALNSSHLPGLNADRLEARGCVFLRRVESAGAIRLLGAKLGGDISCTGARLKAGGTGYALSADRLEARGGVFLSQVESEGEICLLGAKLGGELACVGARLKAGKTGRAFNADGARVTGTLFWREVQAVGRVSLIAARFGQINDDKASWPDDLELDRCLYDAFVGYAPVTGADRIDWLNRQDHSGEGEAFEPQPWEHCARVLREMGHEEAALEVLVEKEKRQRAAARREQGEERGARDRERVLAVLLAVLVFAAVSWEAGSVTGFVAMSIGAALLAFLTAPAPRDALFGALIAYGHRPRRAFLWLALAWFIGGMVFQAAADQGQIKPNNVRAVMSQGWVGCVGAPDPVACFQSGAGAAYPEGAAYPRFNAWIYSADTLLPIVDLELQSYWIPAEEAGWLGAFARWFLWAQIAFGWALSLLAVAGFSGLIRRG